VRERSLLRRRRNHSKKEEEEEPFKGVCGGREEFIDNQQLTEGR